MSLGIINIIIPLGWIRQKCSKNIYWILLSINNIIQFLNNKIIKYVKYLYHSHLLLWPQIYRYREKYLY